MAANGKNKHDYKRDSVSVNGAAGEGKEEGGGEKNTQHDKTLLFSSTLHIKNQEIEGG